MVKCPGRFQVRVFLLTKRKESGWNMSLDTVILVLIVILLANIVETITGFAGTLLAMPFVMLLLGMDQAKVLMNLVSIYVGLGILAGNRQYADKRQAARIIGFMLVGIVAGLWIYSYLPAALLLKGYGVMIMGIAVRNLFFPGRAGQGGRKTGALLFLAGVIHGMFVSGGALLVVYAAGVLKGKHEFRATMALVWIILNTTMAVQQVHAGLFSGTLVSLAMFAILPVCMANMIGNKIYKKISQKMFMKITYVLLLLSGASVLV